MRIGLFTDTYYPEKNGVAVSTYQLKQGLEALGHQVYVFTIKNREAEPDDHVIRLRAVRAVVVDGQRMALPLFHHYLKIVESMQLDVIHTQTEFTIGILGWLAAKRFGIPHVHTYHTVYEEYTNYIHLPGKNSQMKPLIRRLSAWWCNQTDLVIAPTEKTETLLRSYQVDTEIEVVPTGLQLDKFAGPDPDRVAQLRRKYGLQQSDRVLLYLGRVSGEKNIDQLIQYTKEASPWKLLIVGGGPAEEALRAAAASLTAAGSVIFTGMVSWDDVQDYYALGDVFVSASTSETQGLTYYEAMASGLPLLVHRDDCLKEILTDGVQGYSFTDEESFRTGLAHILADRDSFADRAKESAARFSASSFAERIAGCYQDLVPETESDQQAGFAEQNALGKNNKRAAG